MNLTFKHHVSYYYHPKSYFSKLEIYNTAKYDRRFLIYLSCCSIFKNRQQMSFRQIKLVNIYQRIKSKRWKRK